MTWWPVLALFGGCLFWVIYKLGKIKREKHWAHECLACEKNRQQELKEAIAVLRRFYKYRTLTQRSIGQTEENRIFNLTLKPEKPSVGWHPTNELQTKN